MTCKRLIDVSLSLFALIILSPVLAIVAAAVAIKLGRPIFFLQERAGLGGRSFRIIKFRTMTDAVGADGEPLLDEERLTPLGNFLRSSSLDELPELINVVKGDMSLVGPRPLLMKYLSRYSDRQARRHEVLPGLTGWAQVNGRNALDWEERLDLDVWYVDNHSLWLDLSIFLKTFAVVLNRHGVSAEGHVTMPEFLGAKHEGVA